MPARHNRPNNGFTLIELLIVVTILTVLAVSVFVALNPQKRINDAQDARRSSDVDTVLTSIHQLIVDTKGDPVAGIDTNWRQLGTGTGCNISCGAATTQASCLDLSTTLAPYLKSIPVDPDISSGTQTGYAVSKDANDIYTVRACLTEGTTVIEASR